jgi:hypothetical protein
VRDRGSDSLAVIAAARAIPVAVTYRTDCLVLLQQGDVAAISTDDSILAGLAAQDPLTKPGRTAAHRRAVRPGDLTSASRFYPLRERGS